MTKKPLSTISFNTEGFLVDRLRALVDGSKIQSYIYICHKAEKDTTKDHIHLIIIPSSPIDPLKLRRYFLEPCAGNLDLGCLPFQPSKVNDWLLYSLHYPRYLLKKGLSREYVYRLSDLQSNEPEYFLDQIYHDAIEEYTDNRLQLFIDRIKVGQEWGEILRSGLVPPNQIVFYEKVYRNSEHLFGTAPLKDDELLF